MAMLAVLSACGGDTASDTPVVTPPPVTNQPPVFTSATSVSVAENTSAIAYTASATDADGDRLSYSISGGPDATRFTISASGQLSFRASPNYDLPTDTDTDNVYRVEVAASDGKASTTLSVAVTVTNDKEGVAVRRIATGFTSPVAISPISADAILVAEKAGAIYLLDPNTGAKTLVVQIADVGSVGVTALAAAPSFATDGTFFVLYHNRFGSLVIERYLRNPAGPTVPDNFGPLLGVNAPQYAGGGWLGYDAGGNLLAAIGDAGGLGDPEGTAQKDGSALGKLLRITRNPDPYAGVSPRFFNVATIGKGLHRPNGGSRFDNGILLADRGQDGAEEVNLFSAGATSLNFGWPFLEGTRAAQGTPPAGLTAPVLEYYRSTGLRTGRSIVGGAIGPSAVASLRNQYVFADQGGAIFAVDIGAISAGSTRTAEVIERRDADFAPNQGMIDHPVAVTTGAAGTLFILDADGEVFRVAAS